MFFKEIINIHTSTLQNNRITDCLAFFSAQLTISKNYIIDLVQCKLFFRLKQHDTREERRN